MAGKKTNKSSKTDHVLNLISGMSPNQEDSSPSEEKDAGRTSPAQEVPAKEAAPQESPAKEPAAEPQSPETPSQAAPTPYRAAPILEVARTNHEALSETVHQALEDALQEELREEELREEKLKEEKEREEKLREKEKQHSAEQAIQAEKETSPASPDTHDPQPNAAAEQEIPDWDAAKQPETEIVNVMQILVSENIDRYVDMFDVCRCSRCMADVQALALTNLPAKYVVMDHGKLSSMLGYYRHSFSSAVMIELTKACNIVKQNPHHKL